MLNKIEYEKKIKSLSPKILNLFYKLSIEDRRCRFYDLSKIQPKNRIAKSPIIQFYSSVNNIGNYLPVLGIRIMLSQTTDTWCIHDKKIDFEFINKNYQCAIIGGAGLLIEGFEHFWESFLRECKIPAIIWGVGTGNIKRISKPYRKLVSEAAKRCDLVNVRDQYTADAFNLSNPNISACPTIVYLDRHLKKIPKIERGLNQGNKPITVCYYPRHHAFEKSEPKIIKDIVSQATGKSKFTTNTQYAFRGLDDLIQDYYAKSSIVVTTKLHGAIIAYGLGIPYVAFTRTDKLQAFHERFQNGLSVSSIEELETILKDENALNLTLEPIEINSVFQFGTQALDWINSIYL